MAFYAERVLSGIEVLRLLSLLYIQRGNLKLGLPVYEGFATYGGMSTKEIEAMAVGLREMTAQSVASSSADFIAYFVERLLELGVPVVTPAGGLACYVDAAVSSCRCRNLCTRLARWRAAEHVSGVRMERGSVSMDWRRAQGNDVPADMELRGRFLPRTFTLSHIEYTADRLKWLFAHRDSDWRVALQRGTARAALRRLQPVDGWVENPAAAFRAEFGGGLLIPAIRFRLGVKIA